jgi:transposase-like protein
MNRRRRKYPCPSCKSHLNIVRRGFYFRTGDRRTIQRLHCKVCGDNFSAASLSLSYWQKKRSINSPLAKLLASHNTMRRSALLLGVDRKTVSRRLPYLATLARKSHLRFIKKLNGSVHRVEFDDLETFEHSKGKPISVAMAVESKTRKILAFSVSQMPAKGTIAARSRKRYGLRLDLRSKGWAALFTDLRASVDPSAKFLSDQNPHYPRFVKKFFPLATHETMKGRRGFAGGQGELKVGGYDPMFSLNHTFAMLRANICRLIRRTWCTTKKIEALDDHIALYVNFHNAVLLQTSGV